MPVNEFERQVQQKMDELQLRPSAEVWEEVERRVRKEKKRRLLIIWLPLLALLLGGTGVLLYINKNKNDLPLAIQPGETIKKAGTENKTDTGTRETSQNNISSTATSTAGENKITAANSQEISVAEILHMGNAVDDVGKEPATQPGTTGTKPVLQQQKQPASADENASFSISPASKNKRTTVENKSGKEENKLLISGQPAEINTNRTTTNTTIPETTTKPSDENKTVETPDSLVVKKETVTPPVDSAIAKPEVTIQVKQNKWKWGIAAQTGVSSTKKGDLFGSDKELLYASPDIVLGNTSGPFAPPVLVESPTANISFGLKLFGQKEVSKRLSIQAGLQYQYFSTQVRVGAKVMGQQPVNNPLSAGLVVDEYYTASNNPQNRHTNAYHFAGLNAGLSWKFINKKRFSLYWDNDISVNRLLHTNSLLFDRSFRGYYTDPGAFSKTQLFINTGLSVPVLRQKRFTMMASGFVSYGLTPVLRKSTEENTHLLNYGLGLKFIFNSQ